MDRSQYEAKRVARYERLLAAASCAQTEGNALMEASRQMFDVIPMGQPILIGHHSEGADRRYRARADGKARTGWEMLQRARELKERAERIAANDSISSDDPSAVERLAAKIAELEAASEKMKAANKLTRKGDRDGLLALGYTEKQADKLLTPDCFGDKGFAPYQLTSARAEIRRCKARIQELEARQQQETTERTVNGVQIVDNVEDNRLQAFFDGKPSQAVRDWLKQNGFRWTPSLGCWQAYRADWRMLALALFLEGLPA